MANRSRDQRRVLTIRSSQFPREFHNYLMEPHKFLPNSAERTMQTMLGKLGIHSVDELYADVPAAVRLKRLLAIPDGLSEIELERLVSSKLSINKAPPEFVNFIGDGNWLHYVPSIVSEIVSRGEFYTS